MTTVYRQTQDKSSGNSSQIIALTANKNKNWRVNYLRALNIVTLDLSTPTWGWRVLSREGTRFTTGQETTKENADTTKCHQRTVSVTDEVVRRPMRRGWSGIATSTPILIKQGSIGSDSSSKSERGASPSGDRMATYVLGLRSHLFRARRFAPKDDLVMVDRVSVPIEIPTGNPVEASTPIPSRAKKMLDRDLEYRRRWRSSNDSKNLTCLNMPMLQLLSWEEPSVMLGNGGWPLESKHQNSTCTRDNMSTGLVIPMNGSRSKSLSRADDIVEVCKNPEDEDVNGLTNSEEEDTNDIFKMESDGGYNGGSNVFKTTQANNHMRRTDLRKRQVDEFGEFDDDVVTSLSASFVPPHQMVEYGCFSLGLRDKLKRKPGVHVTE